MADLTPVQATDVTHAGGMHSLRAFPNDRQSHLDPFVLFERFHIESGQGFDTHPHRGFEIVSYMLEGGMVHEDSLGNATTARPGDAMCITTGRGIRHSEMPDDDSYCSGLQLWVNLPRDRKKMDPGYQDVDAGALPVADAGGATVRTVVGEDSPLELQTEMTYRDVEVTDSWTWSVPEDQVGFCYVVDGEGRVDDQPVSQASYAVAEGPASVALSTDDELRAVAVAGVPHGEPIRQRGPFVE